VARAACVIALLSRLALNDERVQHETRAAAHARKLVLVRAEPGELPAIRDLAADLSRWSGDPDAPELGRLRAAIERIAGPPPATVKAAPAAEEAESPPLPEALRPLAERINAWTGTGIVVTEHMALLAEPLPPAPLALLDLGDLYESDLVERATPADRRPVRREPVRRAEALFARIARRAREGFYGEGSIAGPADQAEGEMLERLRSDALRFERMVGALFQDSVGRSFAGADREKVAAQLASLPTGAAAPAFGLSDDERARLAAAWPEGVGPRRVLLRTETGLDGDVATSLPTELAPELREKLMRLTRELTGRFEELRQQVLRGLSAVAADPESHAELTPEDLAGRLWLPPAFVSEGGLHLAVPQLTADPAPLAPPRAGLHIDLDLGARLRVRVTPESVAAKGDIADVIDDIWRHFGLVAPAVA
jgi:hypothetical protein